ncbi:MAG: 3-methyl-2-oxobutanoate hydroxymethyltransferase [Chloroflexi bacterium]|nr:3-methyl-2-oxobutanoate hydroxymethyltransferase [Chloroflexota bacterium]
MRVTIRDLKDMKCRGERIPMITAYDYTSAKIVEEAGIPLILVGDSLGMVVLGYDSTVPVTMDEMVHHIKAVVRGTQKAHVVGDMPFLSYHADVAEAVQNAGRLLKEGGAQSVKLEGGRHMAETVRRIVQSGIPVMGHIGLTPQAVNQLGGYRVQGKSSKEAIGLLEDAGALEEAGAYSVVLECVPAPLSALITERLSIPTIGIGAGAHCDGQVQVFHDLLGLFSDFVPKHARRYANLGDDIKAAVAGYIEDVQAQSFPTDKESYTMKQSILQEIKGQMAQLA